MTFWHGRPLDRLRRLCLRSQLKLGHRVTIFAFGDIGDLPAGVAVEDAETVLPRAFARKIRPPEQGGLEHWRTAVQYSDFFRIRLQSLGRGLWLDSDVYLLRPIALDPREPYFAWEGLYHVGNSVLYLPPTHPITAGYETLMAQDVLFSDALMPYHRFMGHWRRFRDGEAFVPANVRVGLYGPAALTNLAWRYGALRCAGGRKSFYSIHRRPDLFFAPTDFRPIISDPAVVGLHLSPKKHTDDLPAPGSLYEWAERNVGDDIALGNRSER